MLYAVFAAWATAWAVVLLWAPVLWPVALLGFVQNVSFTFVSRGRNSGSLPYHMMAALFSNSIYVFMLVLSINLMAFAAVGVAPFALVYAMSTMPGSVFAHWLAKRLERGRGRNIQEDRFVRLEERVSHLERNTDTRSVADVKDRVTRLEDAIVGKEKI